VNWGLRRTDRFCVVAEAAMTQRLLLRPLEDLEHESVSWCTGRLRRRYYVRRTRGSAPEPDQATLLE
jgi:hypothetical protein